jgi:hypothetical protein
MTDGACYEHYQPTRKGDPDQPLTDAELESKFLELAGVVIGESCARLLLEELWRLDQARSTFVELRQAVAK